MLITFFRCLAQLLSRSGRRSAQNIASGLAGLLFAIYRRTEYRAFISGNLQAALPDLSQVQVNKLARDHVRLLLWSILDLLRFYRFKNQAVLPPEVQMEGWEHFLAAHAQQQGVILVSAHFGCWELIPASISLKGYPVSVMVQKPALDDFDKLFREFRNYAGVKTVNNDSLAGLRPILSALRQAETVGLVIDQHGESRRLNGRFFGHQVSMPEGPAVLAKRTGAVILPVLIRWRGTRHVLEFFPALPLEQVQQQSEAEIMQCIYTWLESQIRRYPENWLWTYNRWDKYPCDIC